MFAKFAMYTLTLIAIFFFLVFADQGMDLFNGTTLSNVQTSWSMLCEAFNW